MPGDSGSPALLGRERERAELDDALTLAPGRQPADRPRRWGRRDRQDHAGHGPRPPRRGARVQRGRGPLSRHRRRRRLRRRPRGGARADRAGPGPRLASLRAPDERAAGPGHAAEPRALPGAGGPAADRARGGCRRTRCCSSWRTCTGRAARRRTSPSRCRAGPADAALRAHRPHRRPAPAAPGPEDARRDRPGPRRPAPRPGRPRPGEHRRHRGEPARTGRRRRPGALGADAFGGQPALRRGARGRRPPSAPRSSGRRRPTSSRW